MAASVEGEKHTRVSFLITLYCTHEFMSGEAGSFLPGGQLSPAGTNPPLFLDAQYKAAEG